MRQQSLGIVLLLALCLMSTAIAQEVSNDTSDNSTGNTTANTTMNSTENDTSLENQTNTTVDENATGNDTSLGNETNETGNNTLENETGTNLTNSGNDTDTNSTLSENDTDEPNENGTEDNGRYLNRDDEREIGNLNYPHGAEVRLLQLEKRVTRNLLIGTKVVEAIRAANSEADLAKLNAILDEMESLLQNIKDSDLNKDKTQLAKDYIDFKKTATELTKEFRIEARPFINQTIRHELKGTIDDIDKIVLKNLSGEINATRCEFNANRLEAMLGSLNITNQDLVDRVRACQATDKEIQSGIMDAFRNMSFQGRHLLKTKVTESQIKGNIAKRDVLREIKDNAPQKDIERQRMIQEKIHNRTLSMNRTQVIQSVNDRIANIENMHGYKNKSNCTLCQDGTLCNETNGDNQTCMCLGNNTDGSYQFCGYGRGAEGNRMEDMPEDSQHHLKALDRGIINGGPKR